MVVQEIGFVQNVTSIIFLAEQIVLVAKLLNKKLSNNKIIETKMVLVVALIQTGIARVVEK